LLVDLYGGLNNSFVVYLKILTLSYSGAPVLPVNVWVVKVTKYQEVIFTVFAVII